MIDAEHTYFQPAIDNITTDLEKKYNKKYPVIFSTYQMYLKDASSRLKVSFDSASLLFIGHLFLSIIDIFCTYLGI
jgi:proline dehydrogenase